MSRLIGCLGVALLLATPPRAMAQAQNGLSVRFDPRIELLAIVCRLAGFPEYSIGRVPSYDRALTEYFAAHSEHSVIVDARRLREQHGVSYDAVMSFAIHLDDAGTPQLRRMLMAPDPSLDRRWPPGDAEHFAALLADFVRETRYPDFIASQQAILDSAQVRMERVVRENVDMDAIQSFFGRSPAGAFVMVPLIANGGASFGSRYLEASYEEVYAIIATSADGTGWPAFDANFVPLMIHEFSHSFVNPAVEAAAARFHTAADSIYVRVAPQMQAMAYGNSLTMVNESIVRVSVARYLLAHVGEAAARREVAEQRARGFYWTDELFDLFDEYERDRARYPTLDSFLPRVAEYFAALVPRLERMIEESGYALDSTAY
jgi:hypothetical protein